MLLIDDVSVEFRGVPAIDRINIEVRDRELLGVIGPRGSGKTSLLNCISGMDRPSSGRIILGDRDLTRLPPHRIAGLGVGRTFQDLALFPGLNVVDNITLGRQVKMRAGVFAAAMYWGWAQRDARHREVVDQVIELLELEAVRRTPVGVLPAGLQKRVELGRALALEPQLLLLDEPMSDVMVDDKDDLARFVALINEELGATVLLASHDIGVTMDLCHRVVALDQGRIVGEGTTAELRQDPRVLGAYLDGSRVRDRTG